MTKIILATTDEIILDCFPVMSQLRPHLSKDKFHTQVKLQMQSGF